MIEHGDESLRGGIKECWKRTLTATDPRYIDYFFRTLYKDEYGFAKTIDNHVVSCVVSMPMDFVYNGRVLAVSMLTGLSTLPEERRYNYSHEVMKAVLDVCEHRELITLACGKHPEVFEPYGFETIYKRCMYELSRDNVRRITNYGCAYEPSPIDLLKVYSAFITRFNGFVPRDLEYFVRLKKEIHARGGKLVAYYDNKNRIRGYATILIEGRVARIEECIYLDSVTLMKLINAGLQERPEVHLQVSESENLGLLFQNAVKHEYGDVMARLNDPILFSRLYGKEVHSVKEAFAISRRPLNLNEHYAY